MSDKKTLLGIALGVGATLAAPGAASVVAPAARPFLKGLLKQCLLFLEKTRERLAVAVEDLQDLVAEVRGEVEEELARKGPPRRTGSAAPDGEATGDRDEAHPGVSR